MHNRALQYNDGFFETIIVQEGTIRFWKDHLERMHLAAKALKLELPEELLEPDFHQTILNLVSLNKANRLARLKLKVWRSGAGLYTPETNKSDWVATARAVSAPATSAIDIGICKSVTTSFTPFSFFKGPNSLHYVMAGIEKKERKLDDMLLLDQQGNVAELISSNLFWLTDNTLYTPPLDTGCVRGILRTNVISWASKAGIRVVEAKAKPDEVQEADTLFATNVTGIRTINCIEHIELHTSHPFVEQLKENLKAVPYEH